MQLCVIAYHVHIVAQKEIFANKADFLNAALICVHQALLSLSVDLHVFSLTIIKTVQM